MKRTFVNTATGTGRTRTARCAALLFVSISVAGCGSRSQTAKEIDRAQVETLIADYSRAFGEYTALRKEADTEEAFRKAEEKRPAPVPGAERFLKWAEANSDEPITTGLLATIVQYGQFTPEAQEAADRLARDHLNRLVGRSFSETVSRLLSWPLPVAEKWLTAFLEKSENRETQAVAGLSLALHKKWISERLRTTASRDWVMSDDWIKSVKESFGPKSVDYLATLDADAQVDECIALLERLIDEFGKVKLAGPTVTQLAAPLLYELKYLSIGKQAPEIDGQDLDNKSMRLSEFRGKVVMLSFWASWCGPCMQMVAHERELVQRFEGQPFVLLGVNDDENLGDARRAVKTMAMPWRSWKNRSASGESILGQWNVRGLPTIYILDAAGTVRYKEIFGEQVGAAIETLLREQKSLASEEPQPPDEPPADRKSP